MRTQTWEVRVRGEIPSEVLAELGATSVIMEPAQTVLRTEPLDQPGLHGVLERLRRLGVDLLEIRASTNDAP
jgi:hypothetical protein